MTSQELEDRLIQFVISAILLKTSTASLQIKNQKSSIFNR